MPENLYALLAQTSHSRALSLYRMQNAIWLWLGVASILSTVAWLVDPSGEAQHTVLRRELDGPLDDVWHYLWAVGGMAIILGVWQCRPRVEFVGHVAVSAAITTYTLASFAAAGMVTSVFILAGIAIASGFRAYFLWAVTPKQDEVE